MTLIHRAEWAHPIGGQVFKLGAGGYAVVGITFCGVILIPADVANILFHNGYFRLIFRLQRYDYFLIWQNYFSYGGKTNVYACRQCFDNDDVLLYLRYNNQPVMHHKKLYRNYMVTLG